MTQRSGKFTRGPCKIVPGTSVVTPSIAPIDSGPQIAMTMFPDEHDCLADAYLIRAALNAATTAEDMGYDGQAAVEALPRLLEVASMALSRLAMGPLEIAAAYGPQGHPDDPLRDAARILQETLAACRSKEPGNAECTEPTS